MPLYTPMAGLLAIYNCYKAAGFTMSKTLAIVSRVHLLTFRGTTSRHNELSLDTNFGGAGWIRTTDLLVMSQTRTTELLYRASNLTRRAVSELG
jgi:hypothetical protein